MRNKFSLTDVLTLNSKEKFIASKATLELIFCNTKSCLKNLPKSACLAIWSIVVVDFYSLIL